MSQGMYEVLALIPQTSDFSLERAVSHFSGLTFNKFGSDKFVFKNEPMRAEFAQSEGAKEHSGFRVHFGPWSLVAWLETDGTVRAESHEMAQESDLPSPAEVIAGCTQRLSIWSDEDQEFEWSDEFTEFVEQLQMRFGVFVYDPVNGGWWS
jgi:hypothetical protein